MEMLEYLQEWLDNENTKLIYVLTLILIANIIDFTLGWINAKFNKNANFSSNKAIFGIARKMVMFILLVFFIPTSLLIPYPIGISALWVLYLGYLASEVNSILSHLRLSKDDKQNDLFIDFINSIFNREGK